MRDMMVDSLSWDPVQEDAADGERDDGGAGGGGGGSPAGGGVGDCLAVAADRVMTGQGSLQLPLHTHAHTSAAGGSLSFSLSLLFCLMADAPVASCCRDDRLAARVCASQIR